MVPELTEKQIMNFYKRIKKTDNETDCWEWQSRIDRYGYGEYRFKSKNKQYQRIAHRVALKLTGVDVEGHLVLHSCDNRKCCNPNHLRTGTHQENMKDMRDRGRSLKGVNRRQMKVFKIERLNKEENAKIHEHNENDNHDTSLSKV